eukprot:CAMPEP_0117692290 /NCGR_PEP_ID=MMETSP0804-20121206/26242_1 /TAXON_ID=1074897 /ORGANISM="Tetraselmis astigmatica, Strain CCMP880" /LENGTH=54 /DNA_ID=CAMNT_0005505715 /DNA_START=335 /DNA_END=496 /DNA_ORIENTATION=+
MARTTSHHSLLKLREMASPGKSAAVTAGRPVSASRAARNGPLLRVSHTPRSIRL